MRGFNYKKAVQALNFLAIKSGGEINKMKAIKLIWLSDRLHIRNHGKTITGDTYFALKHGPVPSSTKDILQENNFLPEDKEVDDYINSYISQKGKYEFKTAQHFNAKVFSKSDLITLETIFSAYGHLDQYQLRDLSHQFPEWKKYESALGQISTRFEMDFDDFFINVDDTTGVFIDSAENMSISKDIFHEGIKLQCL